jgi:hypothetical protein
MKSYLPFLILFTASGWGQQLSADQNSQVVTPHISVFQRYSGLRQGSEQDVLVVICAEKPGCFECPFTTRPPKAGIAPVSFEIVSTDGLTASYRSGRRYKLAPTGSIVSNRANVVGLRLHAAKDAALGQRVLRARIRYQPEPGTPDLFSIATFEIPLQIVPGDARITQSDWPYASHVGQHVMSVLTAPLVPFEYLLLFIACHGGGCGL